ncbi:LOW QUALITY PROTEIN: Serine/threonine protein kinase [Trema orientale]|uniref:Serine/threonine protein kinase n=1 Tax=Trema orientale TaxID=63057 RepID=A0A2P5ECR6_TREOI|nr:LOW QUALITY PROTEIN: Serine/threonine protein kinase [Trema orientale]
MDVVDRANEEASSRVNFPLNLTICSPKSVPDHKLSFTKPNASPSELVAIKTIDFEGRSVQSSIDLICDADSLTSSVSHPNVVPAHCSFMAEDEKFWVVMPFLPGGSVLSVMYDSQFGYSEAILADYGVSESWYDPDSGRLRRPPLDTNAANDVPYWVAPDEGYGPKWDIWTLGIVAMEMSYGRPPLSQLQGTESLLLRLRKRFGSWKYEKVAISNLWSFSEEYKDMVSLCLDKDPAKRPSAEDLLKHPFFLKYNKMGPEVIEKYLVRGFPSVEERRSKARETSLDNWFEGRQSSTTTSGAKEENDSGEEENDSGERGRKRKRRQNTRLLVKRPNGVTEKVH